MLRYASGGPLRDGYPVDAHHVDIRLSRRHLSSSRLTDFLGELGASILAADRACRRVVVAVAPDDLAAIMAAEPMGFRHV